MFGIALLLNHEIPQDERIHFTLREGIESVRRRIHDGFALKIERGVEYRRHASGLGEALNQSVVSGVCVPEDGLQATSAIHVRNRGQDGLLGGSHRNNVKHVTRRIVMRRVWEVEVGLGALSQDRWSKRAVGLAKFNLGVDDVLHVGVPRVTKNASIPEGARTPFEFVLKPA